jgi:hypothetical protein
LEKLILFSPITFFLLYFTTVGHHFYLDNPKSDEIVLSGLPASELFPEYLAAPNMPKTSLKINTYRQSNIPDISDLRYGITVGGTVGTARIHPRSNPEKGIQHDLGASIYTQYDLGKNLDNIGWDGFIQNVISFTVTDKISMRFGMHHFSSHLGDEYIESYGRTRINYTRNEHILSLSYKMNDLFRFYGEIGHPYNTNTAVENQSMRYQVGAELTYLWNNKKSQRGYYLATDWQTLNEARWRLNANTQIGIMFKFPDTGRIGRFGFEHYIGAAQIREFYQQREEHIAFTILLNI